MAMTLRLFCSLRLRILDFRRKKFTKQDLEAELSHYQSVITSTQLSGYEISNLLLGLNTHLNRFDEYPGLKDAVLNQLKKNLETYDGRTLATVAWVLRRKRIYSKELSQKLFPKLADKIDDLELKHCVLAAEGITRSLDFVPAKLVSRLHQRVKVFQGKYDLHGLMGLTSSLMKVHKSCMPDTIFYDFLKEEAERLNALSNLRSLSTILYATTAIGKRWPNDYCTNTYDFVLENLNSVSDNQTYAVLLKAYSLQPNYIYFREAFERIGSRIIENPFFFLYPHSNITVYAHVYSKTGLYDQVLQIIMNRMKEIPKTIVNSNKCLGTLLYSFYRRPVDIEFMRKKVTPWLITYKQGLLTRHLRKIIIFKLQNDPEDPDFWRRVGICKNIEFDKNDYKIFKDYEGFLKKNGVDFSRIRFTKNFSFEEASDYDMEE